MLPIGSIVASYLDYKTFCILNDQDPGLSEKSVWFPCDGRKLPNKCKYARSGAQFTPDLRGLFLRGLNEMIPGNQGAPELNPDQENKEEQGVGRLQKDSVGTHGHSLVTRTPANAGSSDAISLEGADAVAGHNGKTTTTGRHVTAHPGLETRPKNVSLFYYIKIN
jgi:hypothetical protein